MSAGHTEHGETMDWYVEPTRFGARRTALSRRRRAEERINLLAVAVTAALLFVLVAGAVMFGGHTAIAPLLPRSSEAAADADRTGSILYAMPDGVFCRRMAFDNATAEITSVAVERCPGAIGIDGPGAGKFVWGRR